MASLYEVPIEKLKGVGSVRAKLFNKLDIRSVGELLRFYPRSYEDWSNTVDILSAGSGVVCVRARLSSGFKTARLSGNRTMITVEISDDSAAAVVVFFNNKYIPSMLKPETEYFFYGKAVREFGGIRLLSPTFTPAEGAAALHPVYRLTAGLTNKTVSNAVTRALAMLPGSMNDPIPKALRDRYSLVPLSSALHNIHNPADRQSLENAKRRLIIEELLVLDLGIRSMRSRDIRQTAENITADYTGEFLSLLPFALTPAQHRAVDDCISDLLHSDHPMNRLVQGDVGSGKTAVAAAVCYTAAKNGWQAAFMAPTEILAEQHYQTLSRLLSGTGVTVTLLTGSMTSSQKKKVRDSIASGQTDIAVGTHALITDKTEFCNLRLAVTDEQHRFGVKQRAKLVSKGKATHLLVMSATPIPRTLALIIYGDLDISVIDELPGGRQKIDTMLIDADKRKRAYKFIREQIDSGGQCYIVCPLVDESESDLAAAEEYAAELMMEEFADYPVGIIHGKMKSADKENVMRRFVEGELKLLVATTVIEVGVDVPNATVMMIENAERFGLSQLHQLRGRVGRGDKKSFCILVCDNLTQQSESRLSVMCSTNDGFAIADEDLRLRGPGDFFGQRQHGLPQLTIADFSDMDSIALSGEIADLILSDSPDLSKQEYRGLRALVRMMFGSDKFIMN